MVKPVLFTRSAALWCVLSLALITPAQANNFWKWTDQSGDLHYTQYPPENRTGVTIHQRGAEIDEMDAGLGDTPNTPSSQNTAAPTTDEQSSTRRSDSTPDNALNAEASINTDSALCAQLDEQRQLLSNAAPNSLIERNQTGDYAPLTPAQITQRLSYFNTLISKHCQVEATE